jgi:D-sedoheptulose 7-phosphate isomerase
MENRVRAFLENELEESAKVVSQIRQDGALVDTLIEVADICIDALRRGNKIMFAGNGGSAADAQHFAAELVGRFYCERTPLAAIALTTDTSMLTAIGNDYGFEQIFSRQVEANGRSGDIFIGISTSGNSKNVSQAALMCKSMKIITVGLISDRTSTLGDISDYCVCVPSNSTPRIQEAHTVIGHALCALIERAFKHD